MTDKNIVMVTLEEFDINKFIVHDPVTSAKTKSTSMSLKYLNEDGEEKECYTEWPTQFCFGVQPAYEYQKEKAEENISNWQVLYYARSKDTVKDPTAGEKLLEKVNGQIRKKVLSVIKKNMNSLPAGCKIIFKGHDNIEDALKPMFTPKTVTDPKTKVKSVDESASMQNYLKIAGYKKKKDSSVPPAIKAKFYTPDNDAGINPVEFRETRGYITPYVHYKSVFLGAHGQSQYAASIQHEVGEANFTEVADNTVPKARIGKPSAPVKRNPKNEENDTDVKEEDDDNETKENKTSKLKALVKSKTKETPEKKKSADSKPPLKKAVATPIKKAATKEVTKKPAPKVLVKKVEPPSEPEDASEDENVSDDE
jgi:hypothetical protein